MKRLLAAAVCAGLLVFGACADDPEEVGPVDDAAVAENDSAVDDFETLDANGDSYLDTDEIAEWADDIGTFSEWDEDADSELDPDEISGNSFELWDSNDDGKITDDEWKESAELWYPNDSDLMVLDDLDNDGDSELDADEFAESFDWSVLGETWTTDGWDEETFKKAYFELYDADDDGKVLENEWTSGAAVFGTPVDS